MNRLHLLVFLTLPALFCGQSPAADRPPNIGGNYNLAATSPKTAKRPAEKPDTWLRASGARLPIQVQEQQQQNPPS